MLPDWGFWSWFLWLSLWMGAAGMLCGIPRLRVDRKGE